MERCTLLCDGCQATLACLATNFICDATCTAGARCEVDCASDETCRLQCQAGAECLLACGAAVDECDLQCAAPGRVEDCGGGVLVCNRACP
jgi:hypothetical protein